MQVSNTGLRNTYTTQHSSEQERLSFSSKLYQAQKSGAGFEATSLPATIMMDRIKDG